MAGPGRCRSGQPRPWLALMACLVAAAMAASASAAAVPADSAPRWAPAQYPHKGAAYHPRHPSGGHGGDDYHGKGGAAAAVSEDAAAASMASTTAAAAAAAPAADAASQFTATAAAAARMNGMRAAVQASAAPEEPEYEEVEELVEVEEDEADQADAGKADALLASIVGGDVDEATGAVSSFVTADTSSIADADAKAADSPTPQDAPKADSKEGAVADDKAKAEQPAATPKADEEAEYEEIEVEVEEEVEEEAEEPSADSTADSKPAWPATAAAKEADGAKEASTESKGAAAEAVNAPASAPSKADDAASGSSSSAGNSPQASDASSSTGSPADSSKSADAAPQPAQEDIISEQSSGEFEEPEEEVVALEELAVDAFDLKKAEDAAKSSSGSSGTTTTTIVGDSTTVSTDKAPAAGSAVNATDSAAAPEYAGDSGDDDDDKDDEEDDDDDLPTPGGHNSTEGAYGGNTDAGHGAPSPNNGTQPGKPAPEDEDDDDEDANSYHGGEEPEYQPKGKHGKHHRRPRAKSYNKPHKAHKAPHASHKPVHHHKPAHKPAHKPHEPKGHAYKQKAPGHPHKSHEPAYKGGYHGYRQQPYDADAHEEELAVDYYNKQHYGAGGYHAPQDKKAQAYAPQDDSHAEHKPTTGAVLAVPTTPEAAAPKDAASSTSVQQPTADGKAADSKAAPAKPVDNIMSAFEREERKSRLLGMKDAASDYLHKQLQPVFKAFGKRDGSGRYGHARRPPHKFNFAGVIKRRRAVADDDADADAAANESKEEVLYGRYRGARQQHEANMARLKSMLTPGSSARTMADDSRHPVASPATPAPVAAPTQRGDMIVLQPRQTGLPPVPLTKSPRAWLAAVLADSRGSGSSSTASATNSAAVSTAAVAPAQATTLSPAECIKTLGLLTCQRRSCGQWAEHAVANCNVCNVAATTLKQAALVCEACEPGFFLDAGACRTCPEGAFCNGVKLTPCREGFTTMGGGKWAAHQCNVCAPGHGGVRCLRCAKGEVSRGGDGAVCSRCPAGHLLSMDHNGRFGDGASRCMACPAGLEADTETGDCRCPSGGACQCPPGWASATGTGAPPCRLCGIGETYADMRTAPGSLTCLRCPPSSLALADGTGCSCAPGFYSATGSPFVEGGCQQCPDNTATAFSGTTSCMGCPPGQVPSADHTQCVSAALSARS